MTARLFAALIGLLPAQGLAINPPVTRVLNGSVVLPDPGGVMGRARVARPVLTPQEQSAVMGFSVTLAMRDFAGLQARVASGERIPWAELEEKYLPLRSDYERVAAWLASQGFTVSPAERAHMTVFAKGSVARIASALGVRFSRVAAPDGEYTSAVSAPAVPAELAPFIVGVGGLQPEFRMRHLPVAGLQPEDVVGGAVVVTPDNLRSAYSVPASATGAGQIIAIIDEAPVQTTDMATFWALVGSVQTTSNVTSITVDTTLNGPTQGQSAESALDVEWAGALAPKAQIRLYLSSQGALQGVSQVITDQPQYPNMTVLSISYGITESAGMASDMQSFSQYTAMLAASGMTILAASGDAGSNPSPAMSASSSYSASNPLATMYPASDPSVTGVGGTTVNFTGTWVNSGEVVWNDIAANQDASGGGVSVVFQKPSWQTGGSVLAGESMRCVPDVAAMSTANLSNVNLGSQYMPFTGNVAAYTYFNGTTYSYGGTSLSCPIWGAIVALINQARASAGNGPIGLLNPHLYALADTGIFNDVASGNNGAYSAGPGYDLCTGLGSPNVANLISELTGSPSQVPASRLVDISTRAEIGTGANIVIAGIYIEGPSGTNKSILVRGVGPALAGFGVSGTLAQPVVGVYDGGSTLIASDAGWGNAIVPGPSTVQANYRNATAADMSQVGAFALTAASQDSAMVITLPVGTQYTVEVSGANSQTGVALAEVYELDSAAPQSLINISARCFVGTGAALAIPGFVVEGTKPMQVLIRGVGPALAVAPFNISGTLGQPQISVYDQNSTLIVSNAGWGNALVPGSSPVAATYRNATAADMSAVGAFSLMANSADSAVVITLPPGSYTAEVTGVNGATGTALAEVYEFTSN